MTTRTAPAILLALAAAACGDSASAPTPGTPQTEDAGTPPSSPANPSTPFGTDAGSPKAGSQACVDPKSGLKPAAGFTFGAPFAGLYAAFSTNTWTTSDGGNNRFAIKPSEPNVVYFTDYLRADGKPGQVIIKKALLKRDACGHIEGLASTPTDYLAYDATDSARPYTMAFLANDSLLLGKFDDASQHWGISQSPAAATSVNAIQPIDLSEGAGSPSFAFVPKGLAAAGEIRAVGEMNNSGGNTFYHVPYTEANGLITFGIATASVSSWALASIAFTYVPQGSTAFPRPSLLNFWNNQVEAYEVDPQGDPMPASKRQFFKSEVANLGQSAVVDPVTGDYLFKANSVADLTVIKGFVAPPPPPR